MFIMVGDIRRSHLLLTAERGEKKGPRRESIGLRVRMRGREEEEEDVGDFGGKESKR